LPFEIRLKSGLIVAHLFDHVQDDVNDMPEAEKCCSTFKEERSGMSSSGKAIILRKLLRR
jgi:hypothetical protein